MGFGNGLSAFIPNHVVFENTLAIRKLNRDYLSGNFCDSIRYDEKHTELQKHGLTQLKKRMTFFFTLFAIAFVVLMVIVFFV